MSRPLIAVVDRFKSTTLIDIREIVALYQDVEGDIMVHTKGGGRIHLEYPQDSEIKRLVEVWSNHVTTTL